MALRIPEGWSVSEVVDGPFEHWEISSDAGEIATVYSQENALLIAAAPIMARTLAQCLQHFSQQERDDEIAQLCRNALEHALRETQR